MDTRIALFFVCGVAALSSQVNAEDTKSSFEGTVVDATTGEPLRKAYVLLSTEATPGSRIVSGPDGRFLASGLDPGEYRVHVERQGYLDCDCLSGVRISTSQKITGVQIKLTKYGAISGRVVDADGDPWPRGMVALYRLMWKHGKRKLEEQDQADVDDRGMFRAGKLAPGKYFVAAQPGGRSMMISAGTYQTSFYPGVMDPSDAVPIELRPGQEVSEIGIKLQAAASYAVRGRINGLDPAEFNIRTGNSRLIMGISRASGLSDDWLDAQLDRKSDNTFEFRGVPSGSYIIRISSMPRTPGSMLSSSSLGEAAVQVSGHDVNDVSIASMPARQLKVSVEIEGADHFDLASVYLDLMSDDGGFTSTSAEDDFIFSKVAMTNYQVRLRRPMAANYFVKSVRAGSLEFSGPMLDLRRSGDLPVTITLSNKGASIKAVVKAESPDSDRTTVVLIPDIPDAELREREATEVTPDHNGIYATDNIPPGEYRLFAFADLPEDAWNDPDFWNAVREKGVSVKLAESEKKAIELPLIPLPEIAALLARLGIQ